MAVVQTNQCFGHNLKVCLLMNSVAERIPSGIPFLGKSWMDWIIPHSHIDPTPPELSQVARFPILWAGSHRVLGISFKSSNFTSGS